MMSRVAPGGRILALTCIVALGAAGDALCQWLPQGALYGAQTTFPAGVAPYDIDHGDFNEDGNPDLVVANLSNKITVFRGNGNGTFQAGVGINAGNGPVAVAVGHLNGDAHVDVVTANTNSRNVSVFLGLGNGGFQPAMNYVVGREPAGLALGDMDHDGDLDLVVTTQFADSVKIMLGDGHGAFAVHSRRRVGDGPGSVAVGHLNDDGDLDVAVANQFDGTLSLLRGDGIGGMALPATIVTTGDPYSILIEDLDLDGEEDIAASIFSQSTVNVYYGEGDGSFGSVVKTGLTLATSQPAAIIAGDFDDDRIPDVATANFQTGDASFLLGSVYGTLGQELRYGVGVVPRGLTSADFDNDGYRDLATANLISNNMSVLLNRIHVSSYTEYVENVPRRVPSPSEEAEALPAVRARLRAAPNPLNPSTIVSFDLADSWERVEISVYDLSGRRVRSLYAGTASGGRAVWNGTDDGGRPVASGVYLILLEGPSFRETTRVTVLR